MESVNIIRFKTKKGEIFNSEEECKKAEELEDKIYPILDQLGDKEKYDSGCSFSNGKGFIQHNISTVNKLKEEFHQIATDVLNDGYDKKQTYDPYFIGRYLDDGNYRLLYRTWGRLQNIDDLGREFGQGYYRLNPDKAELIQLNK